MFFHSHLLAGRLIPSLRVFILCQIYHLHVILTFIWNVQPKYLWHLLMLYNLGVKELCHYLKWLLLLKKLVLRFKSQGLLRTQSSVEKRNCMSTNHFPIYPMGPSSVHSAHFCSSLRCADLKIGKSGQKKIPTRQKNQNPQKNLHFQQKM